MAANPFDSFTNHVASMTLQDSDKTAKHNQSRIIVVSNRLPVTAVLQKKIPIQGQQNDAPSEPVWSFSMSSGGLVAGLEGVKKKLPFLWVGWTGCWIPEEQRSQFSKQLLEQYKCIPVFMQDKLADDHYNGFSNGVLWPLFHYLVEESGKNYKTTLWKSYKQANEIFAQAIVDIWKPGDLVWVHDYHLIPLAKILRKKIPKIRIGFFLHIPFPSSEIFQVSPVRKSILEGLLNCDLVGFHTYDYARHFLTSCSRLLGLDANAGGVIYNGRFVPVSVFPIGIDPEKFESELKVPRVRELIDKHKITFQGKKVILSVDRLDYIKGIPHRLRAYEDFLIRHPEWHGKVVLIQIAVPSRTDVEEYKKLKQEVDKLVGRINGQFGDLSYHPIHYMFKSVPFHELCALYYFSDIMLITSIRDGMNLVAQEYIACQRDNHGVLILSEFAGSASALSGAIMVNPYNVTEVANSIHEALTMSEQEKAQKFIHLHKYVTTHTASRWGETFIKELKRVTHKTAQLETEYEVSIPDLITSYKVAKKRLLIFSSDGALISYASLPFLASPSRRLTTLLTSLCEDPNNIVFIVSGRDRQTLGQWFGNLPVGLVAEHGYFFCENCITSPTWSTLDDMSDLSWKQTARPLFQHFTERTPGSFFEEKEASLTWHFRNTEFGALRAKELRELLDNATFPANVICGERTIEVRPYGCNYTTVTRRILSKYPDIDFMLYIGEQFATSVEIQTKPEVKVYALSVGRKYQGKYLISNTEEVLQLLEKLTACLGSNVA